jgi:hypothetical protein
MAGTKKLWDRPPEASALAPEHRSGGDATEEVLHLAVGRALSKWEDLEAGLAYLFSILAGGKDDRHYLPAANIIGATRSVNTRCEMIRDAATGFAQYCEFMGMYEEAEPYLTELKKLMKAYAGWSERRNDIAHGSVTSTTNQSGTTYLLCPSHGNTRKWSPRTFPLYQYKAEEIDKFAAGFDELNASIRAYSERLEEWQKTLTRARR